MKRGEIYYADLNPVIGSEQGGIRPVLIIQNDIGNYFSKTTIVAPLTTKRNQKLNIPTHYILSCPGTKSCSISIVLLEQIRVIDKSRLKQYVGTVDEENMDAMGKRLQISLGISYSHFQ